MPRTKSRPAPRPAPHPVPPPQPVIFSPACRLVVILAEIVPEADDEQAVHTDRFDIAVQLCPVIGVEAVARTDDAEGGEGVSYEPIFVAGEDITNTSDLHDRAIAWVETCDWPAAEDEHRLKTQMENAKTSARMWAEHLRRTGKPCWYSGRTPDRGHKR